MNAMPLSFEEFQGKGALDFASSTSSCSNSSLLLQHQQQKKWQNNKESCCYVGFEPTSTRSPSPPTSSSTVSSSFGGGSGGASTDSSGVAETAAVSKGKSQSFDTGTGKCGLSLEDWENDQSILRLIMGDVDDPSLGLNKILQPPSGSGGGGGSSENMEFNAGFGMADHSFGFDSITSSVSLMNNDMVSCSNPVFDQNQAEFTQNPFMFFPSYAAEMQEHNLLSPPPPKRFNSGTSGPNYQVPKVQFSASGPELYLRRQQLLHQRPTTPKIVTDEMANQQLQQAIIDQLIQAAELIETGDPVLAQGILARLNHQLSPVGKPFIRAAFYFKEALQLLLRFNTTNTSTLYTTNMIFKIGAYKSFSEISPTVQFVNFTCNQALLEVFEGCNRVHIIDFDIGYGGQWASLIQELVLRNGDAPCMKITAFACPTSYDEFELGFTIENLKHYANEINMGFDIEIVSLEALNSCSWSSLPLHFGENETIAVNLPIGSFSNYPSTLPLILRFVKQLSPKIVVSSDRGCDRTDVPFPHHIIHALQSYSGLLESLDAVNMNLDALEKIERFFLQPSIEKIVLGRHRSLERRPPWRSLFIQSGFSPLTFSNFTESQAECLVQRTPIRGFHVEKRQSALVLCWQRRELIAASAWRC
ncbi:hypothetical protein ERO13_A12G094700v2 [Gossypium hirsutum]|uniref:Scarecrow-like protein 6 n=1 Tax=Gossypium hirsutum TaxID=3635 RepID=A0A1U8L5B6_GOSHI|nr:scarecrow-like protein 6 [Gossypium hirsutum]KAG4169656.1 hypothetical protein ERO13_A12G094700v2 [Gossypium hirsutum]